MDPNYRLAALRNLKIRDDGKTTSPTPGFFFRVNFSNQKNTMRTFKVFLQKSELGSFCRFFSDVHVTGIFIPPRKLR